MDAILSRVKKPDDLPQVEHPSPTSYRDLVPAAAIDISGLTKTLGGRRVLDGVSLSVYRGETVGIIGGSGAGKSVTLKHIVGLLRPDSGSVRILGAEISGTDSPALDAARRKIGFLVQGAALMGSMTVFDNVALPLREHESLSEDEVRERVNEKLALVGLLEDGYKMPSEISGGMRKRVGLARAIIRNPEILLYDEPTAGLDPVIASNINDLILEMQEKLGVTSVLVTHDMSSAFRVSDRIAMLLEGRILTVGTPAELKASRDPVIRQFVYGDSEGPLTRVKS